MHPEHYELIRIKFSITPDHQTHLTLAARSARFPRRLIGPKVDRDAFPLYPETLLLSCSTLQAILKSEVEATSGPSLLNCVGGSGQRK